VAMKCPWFDFFVGRIHNAPAQTIYTIQ
jgi:hypothetical protein